MTAGSPRIVVDALNLSHGGGTVVMGRIADALASSGARVTVLVARQHALEVVQSTKAEVVFYPEASGAGRALWFRHSRVRSILSDLSAEALVGFNYYTPAAIPKFTYFFNAIPFLPFRQRVATIGPVRAIVQGLSARKAIRESTLRVFESEYLRDTVLAERGRGDNDVVSYAGIDVPSMAGARLTPPTDPLICIITSGARHKRNDLAITTFFKFQARHPAARLEVFGRQDHILASLSHELRTRCLSSDNVVFRGYVDRASLFQTLATASALLTASELESFYMVALEAMVVGCPVVAADISSVRESTGEAGRLFDPGDEEAAIHHLLELHHPELWAKASTHCYDWAKNFEADRLAQNLARHIIGALS